LVAQGYQLLSGDRRGGPDRRAVARSGLNRRRDLSELDEY
jgi:hypothetical protein